MIITSLVNDVENIRYGLTPSSEDRFFPVANLRTRSGPYMPWRSKTYINLTTQYVILDFITPRAVGMIGATRVNVSSIIVQAGDSVLTVNQSVSVTRNPLNGRYSFAYFFPQGYVARFVALAYPLSTVPEPLLTSVGEPQAILGGLWVGNVTLPPRNPLFDVQWEMVDPKRSRLEPDTGFPGRNIRSGYPYGRITMNLRARGDYRRPFVNTELRRYAAFLAQLQQAGRFGYYENSGDASLFMVMQVVDEESTWQQDRLQSSGGSLTLEEAP